MRMSLIHAVLVALSVIWIKTELQQQSGSQLTPVICDFKKHNIFDFLNKILRPKKTHSVDLFIFY